MLKAVIFDLDDTLYDYQSLNQSSINALSLFMQERLGIPENLFYEAFNWARKETKIRLGDTAASHNRLLYCQKTLEYLQAPPLGLALDMYECYWGHFLGNICLRDGAEELLRHCKTNHMKVGVCTDLTSHIQHRKIRKLGIANEINAFVSSEEVGAEKPAEIMYQAILKKLKATPKEAIFIGDDLEKDVVGPERAGMKAIWLHAEKSGPYQTCPSLKEVKGYLNGCR